MPPRTPRKPLATGWLRRAGAPLGFLRPRPTPGRERTGPAPARSSRHGEAAPTPKGEAAAQRAELLSHLVVADPATQPVRHLLAVHGALRAGGWTAVDALEAGLLGRALFEAEILAGQDPPETFVAIVERLREAHGAATERAERIATDAGWHGSALPVATESDFAEFESIQRSWAGTVPSGL